MFGASQTQKAFLAPFVVFMALLALGEAVAHFFEGQAFWMVSTPRYWIFPLQTLVCAVLLIRGWRHYDLHWPARPWFTLTIAVLVFVLWISPQALFHAAPRTDGFDPAFFGGGWHYVANTAVRWLRLVVVVPLLEEIFWRGFLLRFLIREPFEKVPVGTFTWASFAWVTFFFAAAHWGPDFWAALLTGALYNIVAYRTRSLSSCVLAHAVTNLLLGIYIFATGQWGFW
jgi:CAAX prenyl protease-like protein